MPVEFDLVAEEMEELDEQISIGQENYNWNSPGTDDLSQLQRTTSLIVEESRVVRVTSSRDDASRSIEGR